MHQLEAGRSPSLLPFDSLLLPHPVDPAWRRKVAEAHSKRYATTPTVAPHDFDSVGRCDITAGQNGSQSVWMDMGVERNDKTRSWGLTAEGPRQTEDNTQERVPLKIGFVGHDFSEHPTAHMMEGVFVWQRRFVGSENRLGDEQNAATDRRQRRPSRLGTTAGRGEGGIDAAPTPDISVTSRELGGCCR